jgi:hypothetical protein
VANFKVLSKHLTGMKTRLVLINMTGRGVETGIFRALCCDVSFLAAIVGLILQWSEWINQRWEERAAARQTQQVITCYYLQYPVAVSLLLECIPSLSYFASSSCTRGTSKQRL